MADTITFRPGPDLLQDLGVVHRSEKVRNAVRLYFAFGRDPRLAATLIADSVVHRHDPAWPGLQADLQPYVDAIATAIAKVLEK